MSFYDKIIGHWSAQKYDEVRQELAKARVLVQTGLDTLDRAKHQIDFTNQKLDELKTALVEEQSHPYSLLVDKETAREILKSLVDD